MECWSIGPSRNCIRRGGLGDAVWAADCVIQSLFYIWSATNHPAAPLGRGLFKPIAPELKPLAESLPPFGTRNGS